MRLSAMTQGPGNLSAPPAVFWAYLGVIALVLAALPAIPETVLHPDRAFRLKLRIGVPPGMRMVMLGAGLGAFAAFTLLGLFSSLMPGFVRGVLGVTNLAVIGATAFLIFLTAAISQAASARMTSRRSVTTGLPLLLAGLAALEISLFTKATWLFLVGTVASGIAVGLIFRGGLSEINAQAPASSRGQAVSTFFAAAYLGLPVVLIGLITLATGTVDASAWVAGLVAVVILAAAVIVTRTFGKAPEVTPRTGHTDGWCDLQPTAGAASRSAADSPAR
jgi:hypothetical protein